MPTDFKSYLPMIAIAGIVIYFVMKRRS